MDQKDYAANGIVEIIVKSSRDGSLEPSLYFKAPGNAPRPLLVALHTWSADRHNQADNMLPLAKKHGWDLLLPEFRGPNLDTNPRAKEACASKLALQDIIDACEHVKANSNIMENGVMLFGASGGGHMAMMLSGYRPDYWRTVAAFVGISDLSAWHGENPKYSRHIEACCGGKPAGEALAEYRLRSPATYAAEIAKANFTLYHGKYDPSVPFTQSVRMFALINEVAPKSPVFLNIFQGAHEAPLHMVEKHLLDSLAEKVKGKEVTG